MTVSMVNHQITIAISEYSKTTILIVGAMKAKARARKFYTLTSEFLERVYCHWKDKVDI